MTTQTPAHRPVDPFVHPALFYRDTQEYLAGTAAFVREGLAAGEPVAVAVPGPNLALLCGALGADVGRVRLMDMAHEGRNPGRIIPGVLNAFVTSHPGRRVRIIGEPIWAGRSPAEYPACAQHEALINAAFTGREVSILCPYDVRSLDPVVLADARATHPVLIDGDGQRISPDFDPQAVVDTYNRPLSAPPATARTLSFDVASLSFARRFVLSHARTAGMAEDRLPDLELAVAETSANSVEHGGGRGVVTVWTETREFLCQIDDHGHITDPLIGRLPVPDNEEGGRGLLMVNHLADLVRVYTATHGTSLRLHFALPAVS
jgi:anti-sigma regulatory factor (Ser/Thr protein kinase)